MKTRDPVKAENVLHGISGFDMDTILSNPYNYIKRFTFEFSASPKYVATPANSTPSMISSFRIPITSMDMVHATSFTPFFIA